MDLDGRRWGEIERRGYSCNQVTLYEKYILNKGENIKLEVSGMMAHPTIPTLGR